MFRFGHAAAKDGCLGILKRLIPVLRQAFPNARLSIRLDAGFTGTDQYHFFETRGLEYDANCIVPGNTLGLLMPFFLKK